MSAASCPIAAAGHEDDDGARTFAGKQSGIVRKPIVALSLVRLVRKRRVRLEESLGSIVPELAGTFAGALPIELLLAHRAGLAAHIELFAPLRDGHRVDRERGY